MLLRCTAKHNMQGEQVIDEGIEPTEKFLAPIDWNSEANFRSELKLPFVVHGDIW